MKSTKEITLAGMMIAIMAVMAFIPQLGYIQITPTIGVTTMHIPVIIGAILLGRKFGLILGTTFGILSLIITFQRGVSPFELFFLNPLVSVLPRVLFGIAIYEVYRFIKLLKLKDVITIPVTAVITTLIHTILVLGSIALVYGPTLTKMVNSLGFDNIILWIGSVIISNAIFEAVFAGIVVTFVAIPLKKMVK